jgi:hypothetical protein
VAIYQGVSQDIGPWSLSHVSTQTDVMLADLPDYFRERVNATMTQSSADAANAVVTDLRTAALACQTQKANGRPCGSAITIPSVTSPSGTATTPATPSRTAPTGTPTTRPRTTPTS